MVRDAKRNYIFNISQITPISINDIKNLQSAVIDLSNEKNSK